MVRVTVWPQLLLVVLILRQSAAVSDQCSQLQEEEISRLERDIVRITELKHNYERLAGNCDEHLTKQILISQATTKELNRTARKLNESEAVNSGLKKQLEVKEEVLKSINEKQTELQTTIDDLTKTVESLNERSKVRCGIPEYVCRSLLKAAKSGDVNSVKRLVKCDSNDKCTDYDGYRNTPLIYAVQHGHVEVVRVLLEGGANVDRANTYEDTALHRAALYGHLDVCRLLLDWGAKVDALNVWQNTPLHYAALHGHLSVVKLLVERGADVSVKGVRGRTASDWARINESNKDVAHWLDSNQQQQTPISGFSTAGDRCKTSIAAVMEVRALGRTKAYMEYTAKRRLSRCFLLPTP